MYTSYVTRKGTLKQRNKSPIAVASESSNVFYVKNVSQTFRGIILTVCLSLGHLLSLDLKHERVSLNRNIKVEV